MRVVRCAGVEKKEVRLAAFEDGDPLDGLEVKHLETSSDDLATVSGGPDGFYNAFATAYANHLPLTLSPWHCWLMIARNMSRFIALDAERVRHLFVSHSGQKSLEVEVVHEDWAGGIRALVEKTKEEGTKVDLDVQFSVEDPASEIASKVMVLDSLQAYFRYTMRFSCGIPEFHVLGTQEDWQTLAAKVAELKALVDSLPAKEQPEEEAKFLGPPDHAQKVSKWIENLLPVLGHIGRCDGEADARFWASPFHVLDHGYGHEISGWVQAFFLYGKNNNYVCDYRYTLDFDPWKSTVDPDDLCISHARVPLHVNDNGREYDAVMVAGFFGVSQDPDTLAIVPRTGWAVGVGEQKHGKHAYPTPSYEALRENVMSRWRR